MDKVQSGLAGARPRSANSADPKPVVTVIEPTKAKSWVAGVSAVLTVLVPYVLSVSNYLPDPWPAVVGGVIGVLGLVGVYKVPNHPKDTSIVPNSQITSLPPDVGYTPVPDVQPSPNVDVQPSHYRRPAGW
jgi:hypothetical protein